jgi:hypothetical protein
MQRDKQTDTARRKKLKFKTSKKMWKMRRIRFNLPKSKMFKKPLKRHFADKRMMSDKRQKQ